MLRIFNFRKFGKDLYLLQSVSSDIINNCPIYKWSGYNFDLLEELPCMHSMNIEPFIIGSDVFIAIANYKNKFGKIYQSEWSIEMYLL